MKKNKLVNIVLIMIISLVVLLTAKTTLAATNNNIIDITNGAGNSINKNNISTDNNSTNNSVNNTANSTGNNVLKTNNTSNYNNSSLPKTGIEDSISGIVLAVILVISAVYAYNKIQYYKNI